MIAVVWTLWTYALPTLHILLVVGTIPWILTVKHESTSVILWCLIVMFVPFLGFLLFVWFGYSRVERPIRKKKRQRLRFYEAERRAARSIVADEHHHKDPTWQHLGSLAAKSGASPVIRGNAVTFFHEAMDAWESILQDIEQAKYHIHIQFYIIQADKTGKALLDLLTKKVRAGVEVRLLFDALGSVYLKGRWLKEFSKAGGSWASFLPLNLLRRRYQVNLRNHRKIVVVDGEFGHLGGMNVGDEYLGKSKFYGYWRDSHVRLRGPVVNFLQEIFVEDWDFAAEEDLEGVRYFPRIKPGGKCLVQIAASGPDQEHNTIREVLFAAFSMARKRLWIATPYFIPDSGVHDMLRFLLRMGVDVRIVMPAKIESWFMRHASHYFMSELLSLGAKFYEYNKGYMHAKVILIDDKWCTVGSANLDNRSLHLNFESNCILHTTECIENIERMFLVDMEEATLVDAKMNRKKKWRKRLAENVCRLFAPIL